MDFLRLIYNKITEIMSKTRRANQSKAIHIDLSNIKHDTICVNVIPKGLLLSIACNICNHKLDIHSKKSSKTRKREA